MSVKNNRPQIENPLASMGLDDIVRGITTPQEEPAQQDQAQDEAAANLDTAETEESVNVVKDQKKRRTKGAKAFHANYEKYARIGEQGTAIWLPKEVKKKLELLCAQSEKNIPIRSLAAAIIMTYIEENEDILAQL